LTCRVDKAPLHTARVACGLSFACRVPSQREILTSRFTILRTRPSTTVRSTESEPRALRTNSRKRTAGRRCLTGDGSSVLANAWIGWRSTNVLPRGGRENSIPHNANLSVTQAWQTRSLASAQIKLLFCVCESFICCSNVFFSLDFQRHFVNSEFTFIQHLLHLSPYVALFCCCTD